MKSFLIIAVFSVCLIGTFQFNINTIGNDINNVIKNAGNDVNNIIHNYNSQKNITQPTSSPVTPALTPQQEQNALLAAIQGQLGNKDQMENEASASSLVNNIKSIGVSHFLQCTTAQLTSQLAPFNLPTDVVQKINAIVYMQSTAFQGFILIIQGSTGTLTQVAGAARNVKGTVQLAFVNAYTTGAIVQQYKLQPYITQNCHFCTDISTGFKCCNDQVNWINLPTSLNGQQIEEVQNALQTAGIAYIQQQLDNPPAEFKNYANLGASTKFLN